MLLHDRVLWRRSNGKDVLLEAKQAPPSASGAAVTANAVRARAALMIASEARVCDASAKELHACTRRKGVKSVRTRLTGCNAPRLASECKVCCGLRVLKSCHLSASAPLDEREALTHSFFFATRAAALVGTLSIGVSSQRTADGKIFGDASCMARAKSSNLGRGR